MEIKNRLAKKFNSAKQFRADDDDDGGNYHLLSSHYLPDTALNTESTFYLILTTKQGRYYLPHLHVKNRRHREIDLLRIAQLVSDGTF